MPKKLEEMAAAGSESQLAKTILESANQIWLAGLGAFAKTQEEGMKLFDSLVKEGEHLQKRARKAASEHMAEMSAKTSEGWDKLEQVFEGRVARALATLNVPTKRDIDTLGERVAKLTEVVEKLTELTEHQAKPARHREPAVEKT